MRQAIPEPSIDDLLDDPILRTLLARDGLRVEDVRSFLEEMKRKLVPRRSGERLLSGTRQGGQALPSERS